MKHITIDADDYGYSAEVSGVKAHGRTVVEAVGFLFMTIMKEHEYAMINTEKATARILKQQRRALNRMKSKELKREARIHKRDLLVKPATGICCLRPNPRNAGW